MKIAMISMTIILMSLGFLLAGVQTATGYYADPDEYGYRSIMQADMYIAVSLTVMSALVAVLVLSRIQSHSF